MSAFNCSKEHYQFIADQLAAAMHHDRYRYNFAPLGHKGADLYDADKRTIEMAANILVADLQNMNAAAVAGRYNEKRAKHEIVMARQVIGRANFNPVKLIKALECTMYQCSEQPVYGSPSYNAWEQTIGNIARSCIAQTKEYEAQPWEVNEYNHQA